jgi:hypothetical protein
MWKSKSSFPLGKPRGVPNDVPRWGWHCGFYPASHAGIREDGIADTFEQARADFEAAWARVLPRCTDADFTEHREQRAFVKWKYRMWDSGCRMPTQTVMRAARSAPLSSTASNRTGSQRAATIVSEILSGLAFANSIRCRKSPQTSSFSSRIGNLRMR